MADKPSVIVQRILQSVAFTVKYPFYGKDFGDPWIREHEQVLNSPESVVFLRKEGYRIFQVQYVDPECWFWYWTLENGGVK